MTQGVGGFKTNHQIGGGVGGRRLCRRFGRRGIFLEWWCEQCVQMGGGRYETCHGGPVELAIADRHERDAAPIGVHVAVDGHDLACVRTASPDGLGGMRWKWWSTSMTLVVLTRRTGMS